MQTTSQFRGPKGSPRQARGLGLQPLPAGASEDRGLQALLAFRTLGCQSQDCQSSDTEPTLATQSAQSLSLRDPRAGPRQELPAQASETSPASSLGKASHPPPPPPKPGQCRQDRATDRKVPARARLEASVT